MVRKLQDQIDTRAVEIAARAAQSAELAAAAVADHVRECAEHRREQREQSAKNAEEARTAHKELMDRIEPLTAWMNQSKGAVWASRIAWGAISGLVIWALTQFVSVPK